MTQQRDQPYIGIGYLHGSHKGPDAPAHCRSCGRPMRVRTTNEGYDPTTGEMRHGQRADCTSRWWQFGFHDHAKQDMFGDWPWA